MCKVLIKLTACRAGEIDGASSFPSYIIACAILGDYSTLKLLTRFSEVVSGVFANRQASLIVGPTIIVSPEVQTPREAEMGRPIRGTQYRLLIPVYQFTIAQIRFKKTFI